MRQLRLWMLAAILTCSTSFFTACSSSDNPVVEPVTPVKQHEASTQALIDALDANPLAKSLLQKSIEKAKAINPDPDTNPAQTLEQYYDYLDWSTKCMP